MWNVLSHGVVGVQRWAMTDEVSAVCVHFHGPFRGPWYAFPWTVPLSGYFVLVRGRDGQTPTKTHTPCPTRNIASQTSIE